ncbi:MAG: TonB-dependent receptor [Bryobacteraceae bacterium]
MKHIRQILCGIGFSKNARLSVAALCALSLFAQSEQGRLNGIVMDSSGAVIPGASITAKNLKTGIARSAAANDSGQFVILNLAAAQYAVTVTAEGMATREYKEVPLAVGETRALNVTLEPEGVVQQIDVSAGALAEIDTSSARIGVNVSEREVAQLPLNGRQISQLYLLAPGATSAGGGSYDNIRFSGRSNQQNAIRYDGVEGSSIIDASPGNLNGQISSFFRLQASLENVQEFRVESNNYPAEYGTGTGGQISVVTKSGGNDFHGGLFEYVRNNALDARNFFDRGKSPLRMNQFGGSLGGAIVKEKLFFFGSYEGLRQSLLVPFREAVPSAAARARAVDSIRPLLAAYPIGVQPTSNPDLDLAFLDARQTVTENSASMRLDYRINSKYTLYGRFFRDQGRSFQPIGVTGNGIRVSAIPQNAVVNLQQILSPSVINETKVGLNAYKTRAYGYAPSIPGIDLSALSVVATGSVALSGITTQGASAGVATPGGLVRANSATNGRGQPYTNYSVSFIDNLSWVKGNHTAKFGFEFRPVRLFTDRLGGTTYSFSNVNDLLANRPLQIQFLGDMSAPSPFNNGATGERALRQEFYIAYAQDEWRIRPNFTMSYGLRYEYYSPFREARNLAVVFDTERGQLLPSGTRPYQSSRKAFGPRLAFTWAPERFHNRTTFRVGAGYYYGPGQPEDLIQPFESDRVSTTLASGSAFPINPAQIIAAYDIDNPRLRFQPRAYAPGYRVPEQVLSYTASIQQRLPGESVLTVAYVGSQGRNLFIRTLSNLITDVGTNPATGAAIVTRQFGDRFAEVDVKTSGGVDHYDALQVTLNRRFSRGLTLGSSYTWGHSRGNSGGSNETVTVANPYNWDYDRGDNGVDIRHNLNLSALYELPYGPGRKFGPNATGLAGALLGGWQLGGILNARAGLPLDPLIVRPDVVYRDNRDGRIYTNPVVVNGAPVTTAIVNVPGGGASRQIRRPDYVSGVSPYLQTAEKTVVLNPAAFSIPAPGAFGNASRYSLRGPGLAQVDLTLQKSFALTERFTLQFRGEMYNIMNKANFANPPAQLFNALPAGPNARTGLQPGQAFSPSTAGGTFGIVNSTLDRTVGLGAARQIQLSLRLSF